MSANTTAAALTDFTDDDTDSPTTPAGDDDPTEREQMIDQFGNGGDIEQVDTEDCVVGDDDVVVWHPNTNPLELPEGRYTNENETEWETAYTDIDGEPVAVFVISNGDVRSIIDADKVGNIAEKLGVERREIIDKARIYETTDDFPVCITLNEGEVTIAPIIKDDSELRDLR